MDFTTILILVGIGFLIVSFVSSPLKPKKQDDLQKKIKRIRDFNATQRLINDDKTKGILIDSVRHKVCLISGVNSIRVYGYKDILDVELVEDGKSLMKTSSGSIAGRAIVGGILLGPLGAVVGGVTGKKNKENSVMEVSLRLILNDTRNSIFTYTFLKNKSGIDKDSSAYKLAIEKAKKWHANIKIVIERAEENDTQLHKEGGESFNATFETDKLEYLKSTIGTREKYHKVIHDATFNKIEKDVLLQALVNIKKENPNQTLIERAYNILSKNKSEQTSSLSNKPKEKVIQTHEINKEENIYFSLADEILKLKSLKDDGIISEEDFLLQKDKLLNQ